MKKNIHIISHTHWDREWYLSSKYVNKWIPIFFENLFEMLEKEPEYRFVLDGQTSIIDDCCTELQAEGKHRIAEFTEKLKKYVQEGRIIIGPYYLQPDWQLISGEALIRNMLYGKEISEAFGGGSNTGWLLDNFGQISQTVQIHEQFGMKGVVVWRGVEFPPDQIKSEFFWESPDGSKLPAVYLLSSYRNGMRLGVYPEHACGRIISEADKITDFAQTDNVLLMNGYDQEMEPDDILPYIRDGHMDTEQYRICQSTPDEYMDAVIEGIKGIEIPVLSGALYSGRYISVFPGILSCRMYLKLKNDQLQRKLENTLEPLGVMGILSGNSYPLKKVDRIWKKLLKNHPHDSICGVSVDDVHTDMEARFAEVEQEAEICVREITENLISRIDTTLFGNADKVFVVFNTTLKEQNRQILFPITGNRNLQIQDEAGHTYVWQETDAGIVVEADLPAYGFRTFGIRKTPETTSVCEAENIGVKLEEMGKAPILENAYLRVEFRENGTFSITDKKSGNVYENMGYLEDCADGGDEYNYSDVTGDVPRTTLTERAAISVVENGPLRATVKVEYLWELPAQLTEDRRMRSEETKTVPVTTYVTLQKESKVLRFRTQIQNCCKDHRIRVMFPTKIQTEYSYAQTQFDMTRHEIAPHIFDDSDMAENVKRIVVGARERSGITQFPQKDFMAVTDGCHGVCVLNRGLPEYEVLPEETTVALTLFRSVGWLARTDLNTRIGDAGPEIFTPDAQCIREMEFRYGISLFDGTVEESRLMERADEMNRSNPIVQTTVHSGELSSKVSFCRLEADGDVQVTGIKCAQDGNGIILRFFHIGKKNEKVRLDFGDTVKELYRTNLAEEEAEKITMENGAANVETQPFRIVTLRVLLKEKNNDFRIQNSEMPPVVTAEDVEREKIRAQKAESEYEEQRDIYLAAMRTEETSDYKNAILKLNAEMKHRTALEAKLSYIYTLRKQRGETREENKEAGIRFLEKTDLEIQKLADQLNVVRVERRAAEYWVDYFQQLEKNENRKQI